MRSPSSTFETWRLAEVDARSALHEVRVLLANGQPILDAWSAAVSAMSRASALLAVWMAEVNAREARLAGPMAA